MWCGSDTSSSDTFFSPSPLPRLRCLPLPLPLTSVHSDGGEGRLDGPDGGGHETRGVVCLLAEGALERVRDLREQHEVVHAQPRRLADLPQQRGERMALTAWRECECERGHVMSCDVIVRYRVCPRYGQSRYIKTND